MDKVETEFVEIQELQPFSWLHYIDDILFIWTLGTQDWILSLMSLINFSLI